MGPIKVYVRSNDYADVALAQGLKSTSEWIGIPAEVHLGREPQIPGGHDVYFICLYHVVTETEIEELRDRQPESYLVGYSWPKNPFRRTYLFDEFSSLITLGDNKRILRLVSERKSTSASRTPGSWAPGSRP